MMAEIKNNTRFSAGEHARPDTAGAMGNLGAGIVDHLGDLRPTRALMMRHPVDQPGRRLKLGRPNLPRIWVKGRPERCGARRSLKRFRRPRPRASVEAAVAQAPIRHVKCRFGKAEQPAQIPNKSPVGHMRGELANPKAKAGAVIAVERGEASPFARHGRGDQICPKAKFRAMVRSVIGDGRRRGPTPGRP